ncbi:MAG TPA: DNA cytosine methyltransferase, partial [Thermomicrobiaceae bacterium]|nr:DNA cytosine methyltransferase [Thermomicrobiaceae bacterium]
MRSIELFTGAGGLALGIHRAGFQHLLTVEYDRDACDTLRLNVRRGLIDWPIEEVDVRRFDYGPYPTDIDLLAGGAPCQPFSLGGKHVGQTDGRNMFPEVFRAVRELRPRAFLLENVRGLTRQSFRPYFDYILEQLAFPHVVSLSGEDWSDHKARLLTYHAAGEDVADAPWYQAPAMRYDITLPRVLNVADYGVPQERHRVFIIGFRHDLGVRWFFP